jgi:predicted enzyme related to lactoylglutathione lyase
MGFADVATLDCGDSEQLAPFWAAALRYRSNPYHAPYLTLSDPLGRSPELVLQKVPGPKRGKNRMHLDLFVSDIETEVSRMERLGARRLSPSTLTGPRGDRWIVMADPDGNEFCVCAGATASARPPARLAAVDAMARPGCGPARSHPRCAVWSGTISRRRAAGRVAKDVFSAATPTRFDEWLDPGMPMTSGLPACLNA